MAAWDGCLGCLPIACWADCCLSFLAAWGGWLTGLLSVWAAQLGLAGWLAGWLRLPSMGGLAGWLAGCPAEAGRLGGWLAGCQQTRADLARLLYCTVRFVTRICANLLCFFWK